MEMNKRPMALPTVCKLKARIDPTPDYQRPPAWSRKQKQLLMDTILRGYDIPKFYWRQVKRPDGVEYEVIDGQQRLRAIWEFAGDGYPLAKDCDPIEGHSAAGLKYSQLPMEVMDRFETYSLDVVIVTQAEATDQEDEVRDMFLRLQNGTTLKAQEKRNAMFGAMRDFVKDTARHPFFANCEFSNSRYTFDHVAAQLIRIELAGGPTSVRDSDLNRMYEANKAFDANGPKAKKVRRVLDFLHKAFPDKTPELERYSVIALYCVSSSLIESFVWQDLAKPLATWFIGFETERRAERTKAGRSTRHKLDRVSPSDQSIHRRRREHSRKGGHVGAPLLRRIS
ncbi:MAG: DUF262 domain-containing protein [Hyphomonadaceae bacterium]|nr:DUF262 domain-containing protein [Hyphomonadaceae bacterium]